MTVTGARRFPSAAQADPQIIAMLREIPVAILSDNLHRSTGSVGLQPFHKPAPLAGTAVTVRCRGGDNLTFLRALDYCRPGDVVVIDAGVVGIVLDGAIRDVAEIRERTFPVYARGVNHRGPYKDGPGEINVPVSIGGMVVNPGDIVVGDQDGLLAFAQADVPQLLEKAQAQQRKEEQTMQAIREGRWDRSFVAALEARAAN